MSHPVITIHPEVPIQEALDMMHKEHVHRFPVVDSRGRMIGLVSETDILNASPSEVTTLSMWEVNYLISKITVKKVMVTDVITVTEDTPIEEAARIMADHSISGLPVMREGKVVGIITETDLFKIFLELMGAREPGIRISALVPNMPGELAKITRAIYEAGGNIMALGTFLGESSENRELTLKVDGVDAVALKQAIEPYVEKILDMRGP
jgi:acetoin utilization protein AcuB